MRRQTLQSLSLTLFKGLGRMGFADFGEFLDCASLRWAALTKCLDVYWRGKPLAGSVAQQIQHGGQVQVGLCCHGQMRRCGQALSRQLAVGFGAHGHPKLAGGFGRVVGSWGHGFSGQWHGQVVRFCKAGAGWRGVALSTKRRLFAKRALCLQGLQKLCQKACRRAKKNLQTHEACRPCCGVGVLSLAAT